MNKQSEQRPEGAEQGEATGRSRRPYVKPGFLTRAAFERQALSCSGCLNLAPTPPAFCSLRS